jgi:hypothetical protein
MRYLPNQSRVEEVLQLFQGAVLAYLVTGDPEPGRRSLARLLASEHVTSRIRRHAKKPAVKERRKR